MKKIFTVKEFRDPLVVAAAQVRALDVIVKESAGHLLRPFKIRSVVPLGGLMLLIRPII